MHGVFLDPDAQRQGGESRRRRLSDRIMTAFHAACDHRELEVAEHLLAILEFMLERAPPGGRPEARVNVQPLVAAHERLWLLRHPDPPEFADGPGRMRQHADTLTVPRRRGEPSAT